MERHSKIYVAGHTGVIGSAVYHRLLADGYDNVAVRSHSEMDLTDTAAVTSFFEQERPEYVFYCAGRDGNADFLQKHGAEIFRMHMHMQDSVIHASYRFRVKRMIYSGSGACYGDGETSPFTEDRALCSIQQGMVQPYAVSKIAGIAMCKAYRAQYGMDFVSALPCHLFSASGLKRENSNILEDTIKRICQVKKEQARSCRLNIWGEGRAGTAYIYQDDCADAYLFLMNAEACDDIVNVVPQQSCSLGEIAEMVKRAVNYEGTLEFETGKKERKQDRFMSGKKLADMGWKPQKALETRIRELCSSFVQSSIGGDGNDR